MRWSASVLSTVSSDTEPSVIITFDSAKYLFNVGENTTRVFLQSRRNWRKTRGIFLSSVSTRRASGLPGLLMTFADSSLSDVNVVGPSGLLHAIASMRRYTARDSMAVKPTEVSLARRDDPSSSMEPIYKDENISVYAVPIMPRQAEAVRPVTEPSSKRKHSPSPTRPAKRLALSPDAQSSPFNATDRLQSMMKNGNFNASHLYGDVAQAWRTVLVQKMFPKPFPVPDPDTKKKKKQKPPVPASAPDSVPAPDPNQPPAPPPEHRRPIPFPGYSSPLPPLDPDFSGSKDLRRRPCLAYAVVGPRVRGKFDVKKAEELGIKGSQRGKLTKGESVTVTVDDGAGKKIERVIRPEECVGESESAGIVLLLDVPSIDYIPDLLESFTSGPFAKYRSVEGNHDDHVVRTVFHSCGDGVLENEEYKSFIRGFSPDVHHLVASREHCADPISFTSAALNQLRLSHLDSSMFPVQKYSLGSRRNLKDIPNLPDNVQPMLANTLINIRPPEPPVQEESAQEHDLFHPAVTSGTFTLSDATQAKFQEARALIQERITSGAVPPKAPGDDVVITSLGTGSAIPNKYRNVSGTLISIPDHGYMLLDCGEGTWGQLARAFGTSQETPNNVWDVLRNLRCLFLSHMHGDHHIGVAKLLAMRQQMEPPAPGPLYMVANGNIVQYLREYSELESLGLYERPNGVIPVYSDNICQKLEPPPPYWVDPAEAVCKSLGLRRISTVEVDHRAWCHGVVIEHNDGWSIVYSGDTVPTENLVEVGQNATLLIHEATLADDQEEMARAKMHSTFGQAVAVGERMNARNTLLTHFSARYPKMPPSVLGHAASTPVLALAFDHGTIRIGDMWKANAYLPAIEQSFVDTQAEEGEDVDEVMLAVVESEQVAVE
ncbi:hypothetical protein CONPUDRAFT_139171 [Coniophora puteana RWD-64-598 SS2]|uniref:ribonuclease Z n=1 Tax=Coniophora puteana (strain RWD-64-598) TaxID=741705 RepID=A0A5M3ME98_CONPW|nr:uncharacterized protein CONPUDRAFT_139171 [Coniophora puteana RWD-64-598 SS2]EIW77124.1 hypothetical protein CONPUDRAFT_139171 [Coniophora puteana RWD-64-598 SS2]